MADNDDMNKSSKTYNGQDPGRSGRSLDELSKIKQDWPKTPKAEKLKEQLQDIKESLRESFQVNAVSPSSESVEEFKALRELKSRQVERIQEAELGYNLSANAKIAREVQTSTKFENVNRATTTMAGSSEFYSRIRKAPDLMQTPTEVIQQNIEAQTKRVSELGARQVNDISGLGGGGVTQAMRERSEQISRAEEDIALNKRLIKMQNRAGMSTEKRLMAGEEEISRASTMLGESALSKRVAAQKFDVDEETEKLRKSLDTLTTTFGEFDQATSDYKNKIIDKSKYEEKSTAYESSRKEVEDQRKLVDEIKRQGGGGGDNSLNYKAGIVSSIARTYQGAMIDDRLTDVRQKAQFAGQAVSQYNLGQSAVQGDMHAMLQLASMSGVKDFANTMANKQLFSSSVGLTAEGMDVTARVGKEAGNLKNIFQAGDAGLKAGVDIAETGGRVVRRSARIANKVDMAETELSAGAASIELNRQMTAIPAIALQAVQDQMMAAGGAVTGMGGSAQAAFATLTDKYTLSRAANLGVSPTEFAGLTGMAAQQVGGGEAKTTIAMRAAAAQNKNILSAEQYVGNLGALSNVGGTSGDLEEILRTAVASGMDNSKNIAQMVQATSAMSQDLAKRGISGAEAVDSMLGGAYQRLKGMGVDENLRVQTAMSTAEIQNRLMTSSDTNIGNVYERQALRGAFPNAGPMELNRLSTLSAPEYAALMQKDRTKGRTAAKAMGLESFYLETPTAKIGEAFEISQKALEMSMGVPFLAGSKREEEALYGEFKMVKDAKLDPNKMGSKESPTEAGTEFNQYRRVVATTGAQRFGEGAGDDSAKVMSAIVEQLKEISKSLDTKEFQKKLVTSVMDKETMQPFAAAGANMSAASQSFKESAEKLSSAINSTAGLEALKTNMKEVMSNLKNNSNSDRFNKGSSTGQY
jgi:hypothetical protein